jgi:hypothetical protein
LCIHVYLMTLMIPLFVLLTRKRMIATTVCEIYTGQEETDVRRPDSFSVDPQHTDVAVCRHSLWVSGLQVPTDAAVCRHSLWVSGLQVPTDASVSMNSVRRLLHHEPRTLGK